MDVAATGRQRRRDVATTTEDVTETRKTSQTSWRPHGDVAATSKHICRGDVAETSPWCEC